MKIQNKTKYEQLNIIALRCEELLTSDCFHDDLKSRTEEFRCADSGIDGRMISELIKWMMKMPEDIEIKTYWHWSRNVVGMFDKSTPNVIYFNIRNLKYKIKDSKNWKHIAATIVHEILHFLDFKFGSEYIFNHGSNTYKKWKEDTVQYHCDWLAEKHYSHLNRPNMPTRNLEETWVVRDRKFSWDSFINGWWS